MKGEILINNIFNLFVIAIILEASVMAIFSMSSLKKIQENTAIESARDALVIILAFVLCYKVDLLTVFKGTGLKLPAILDTIISALFLTRMTNLIREFFSRINSQG